MRSDSAREARSLERAGSGGRHAGIGQPSDDLPAMPLRRNLRDTRTGSQNKGGGPPRNCRMNRPGGPAAGMIPGGNGQFTSTHSRVASHSAFIPPSSANNGCSRLLTASCRLSLARGCARDASHVRSSTHIYGNGTSPTLPGPDASAATTSSAPPNVARMACSDVAWPPLTERMRWPAPAQHFVTTHIFAWRRQPPRHHRSLPRGLDGSGGR